MGTEEDTRASLARIEATLLQMSSGIAQLSSAVTQLSLSLASGVAQPKPAAKRQTVAKEESAAPSVPRQRPTKENAPFMVGHVREIDPERMSKAGEPFNRVTLIVNDKPETFTVFADARAEALPVIEQCLAEGRRVCVWYSYGGNGKYKNYIAVSPMPEAPEPERHEEEPPF